MLKHKIIKYLIVLILLFISFPYYLFAQSDGNNSKTQNLETTGDWKYKVAPYFWFLALDGTVTVDGVATNPEVSFGDIISNFNIGGMIKVEAFKNRYGVFFDALVANLETDKQQLTKAGIDKFKVEANMAILQGGATYRVIDSDVGPSALGSNSPLTLDLLAGVRWTYLDVKLKFDETPNIDGEFNFFDPFVGFQTGIQLPKNLNFNFYADIGGFDLGFTSKISWQILATFGYKFSIYSERKNSNIVVGYRNIYQDYEDGSGDDKFEWNVYLHGPITGLIIDF